MNALLLSAVLQLLLAILLLLLFFEERRIRAAINRRLGKPGRVDKHKLLSEFAQSRMGQKGIQLDSELRTLLNQLGWRKRTQQSLFISVQLGLPVLLALAGVLYGSLFSINHSSLLTVLTLAGIGYLIPKRWLVGKVARRKRQLAEETEMMLPLLRILFEVGMTTEQALRVLAQESTGILPELSAEIRQMLQRVDAGLSLQEELARTAGLLDVDEVTDCFTVLEQLSRQGSGAMASLHAMKELLTERRVTALQEKVSRMSAKMSVVMVAFLFPALMIVLAGPGFMAIVRAFGEMG
ncbi:type II secretion system F family protein [Oceanimonas smirnovii]|uniref:type II secretion system F family protein n=1 Tax=Oceanimonas smirnovii TaxID=264574 RepID=UPI0003684DFB|nr:type II secretion system F family protein [Oceanimonas smirnovii]